MHLRENLALLPAGDAASGAASGSLRTFVTDEASRFTMLAARFLNMQIEQPTLVDPHALYALPADQTVTLRATG